MELIKVKDFVADEKATTVLLLCAVEEKETKSGAAYSKLTLSDGEQKIDANLWNNAKEDVLQRTPEKSLITCEVLPKIYQGAMSYEVKRFGPAPAGLRIKDFIVSAPLDSETMYDEIIANIGKYGNNAGGLAGLVRAIYDDHHDEIMKCSAAKAVHHNFYGGLLYHTLRMMRSALVLTKVYPNVNKEVLLAGVALHDIGKLVELETDELGTADYTSDGNLFGHALIGIEMINDYVTKMGTCDPEHVKMLKHCLAAHHGQLDWGAIVIPASPEAMLLHQIDMIDSRMMQYEDAYETLEPGEMSDKIFGLGTCVYKPTYQE